MEALRLKTDGCRAVLGDKEARATALHLILLSEYGDQLYAEEPPDPLELYAHLEDKFSITIPEQNENRINAILLAVGSDSFYEDEVGFTAVAQSLLWGELGDNPTGEMGDLTTLEILWAVYEVALNRDEHTPPFAPRVKRLIDQIAGSEAPDDTDGQLGEPQDFVFLRESAAVLRQQMLALGVHEQDVARIPEPDTLLKQLIS